MNLIGFTFINMKIGIFTVPLNHNYGGTLQCYALMQTLKKLGHEVFYIDRIEPPKRSLMGKVWIKIIHPFIYKYSFDFIRKYINPKTAKYSSSKMLSQHICKYNFDVVIAGSDQVWRMDYMKGMEKDSFLGFVKGERVTKIAYAASFGHDDWTDAEYPIEVFKSLVDDFSAISVREKSGVDICKNKFNIRSEWVLDPTMLLSIDDYKILFGSNHGRKAQNKIATYILDRTDLTNTIEHYISKYLELSVYTINGEKEVSTINPFKIFRMRFKSIESWLTSIYSSSFVITDSFHGMVFSILFNKQFVVIGNKNRGLGRFNSLLKYLNLEDRLLVSFNEDKLKVLVDQFIDYDNVNSVIDVKRVDSLNFIKTALNSKIN